jgi:hypothetical protein
MGRVYRAVNSKGVFYLKLDTSKGGSSGYPPIDMKAGFPLRYILLRSGPLDITTFETREVYAVNEGFLSLLQEGQDRLGYLPSGVDIRGLSTFMEPFSARKKRSSTRVIGRPAKGLRPRPEGLLQYQRGVS